MVALNTRAVPREGQTGLLHVCVQALFFTCQNIDFVALRPQETSIYTASEKSEECKASEKKHTMLTNYTTTILLVI